jgi:putative intracellular protease/amidase
MESGFEVEIPSPDGGRLQADGFSDPEHESGYSADDIVSLGFKKSPKHLALLGDTKPDGVRPADYDAVFVVGGQSPMITFTGNRKLQQLVAAFYVAGKITALLEQPPSPASGNQARRRRSTLGQSASAVLAFPHPFRHRLDG